MTIRRTLPGLIAAILLAPQIALAAHNDKPAPIQALQQQGLTIMGHFSAPGGMIGYAGMYQGDPIAIYVTPDKQHAVLGTMVDAQGNNMSVAPLQKLVVKKQRQNAWPKLEHSTWVKDGSDDAGRIIYMFTDPNCPYCNQFWENARPWVKAGKVQIRHIIVGIIKPSSLPKAAAILAADDPGKKLDKNARTFDSAGIKPLKNVPAGVAKKINDNFNLMRSMGLYGTPAIFYHDASGNVHVLQGVAKGKVLQMIMGSPKP